MSEQFNKKRSYKRPNTKTNDEGEDEDGPGHLLLLHPHLLGPEHESYVANVPPRYVKSRCSSVYYIVMLTITANKNTALTHYATIADLPWQFCVYLGYRGYV